MPTSEFYFLPAVCHASVSSMTHSPMSQWRIETLSVAMPEQTALEEPQQSSGSQQPDGLKKRSRITRAACSACRKRKAKCDGKRPTCSTCDRKKRNCGYLAEEGVSSQAATRRRLDGYANVLQMLRDAEPSECALILRDLRKADSLREAVQAVQERKTSSTKASNR
ncbi:hypothetical protein D6D08_10273 [Aureobasidium pullulans]|nr:hypothetical protein D6D08_10273 [Aureobasidium pullulans]